MKTETLSALSIAMQCMHLLFAVVWLGSLIDSELFLWPLLKRINAMNVQAELRSSRERRRIGVIIVGTLITGYLRGAVDGVFDRLFSLYGVLFLSAAALTTTTVVWWLCKPTRDRTLGWRLYYPSFALIFALMVGMRVVSPH